MKPPYIASATHLSVPNRPPLPYRVAREIPYGKLPYGITAGATNVEPEDSTRHDQWFMGEPNPHQGREPLRAIHVGPCFCRGGAEQHIVDLAKFLNPRRIRIEKCLVTQQESVDPHALAHVPMPVEVATAHSLRQAARDYDVMLFWGVALDQILGDARPKLCLYLAHGDGAWTQAVLDGSKHVVDHVIAVSKRVHHLVCNGAPTTVILNGVDASRLAQSRPRRQVRRALGFSPHDYVVGYVGRFSPEKRPELLIKTVAGLPHWFKALLVGWGPMEADLLRLANDCIPGRYSFVNACSFLGDYYHAMDAFCLLSTQEGFALVMLEALMCGRPVLATPVGAVPEIIRHRQNGMIVEPDPKSIAAAIRETVEMPAWARGMARQGRLYAMDNGHARRMAREYEGLIEQLWTKKFGSNSSSPAK